MQINIVNLVGRLGRDPEIKFFESGKVNAKFPLAVNNPYNKDQADWFNVEVWGEKTVDVVAKYCKKGSLVGLTGYVKFDHWDDKTTGAARSKPVINADNIYLLGSKQDQQQTQQTDNDDQAIPF
jgi:single-strand DNA-binding protein